MVYKMWWVDAPLDSGSKPTARFLFCETKFVVLSIKLYCHAIKHHTYRLGFLLPPQLPTVRWHRHRARSRSIATLSCVCMYVPALPLLALRQPNLF